MVKSRYAVHGIVTVALSCNGWFGHGELCVAFTLLHSSDKDIKMKGEIKLAGLSQLLAMKAASIIAPAAKTPLGMEHRIFCCWYVDHQLHAEHVQVGRVL